MVKFKRAHIVLSVTLPGTRIKEEHTSCLKGKWGDSYGKGLAILLLG